MKKKTRIKSYIFVVLITMIISVTGTVFIMQTYFNIDSKEKQSAVISNTIVWEKIEQIDQWATIELEYGDEFTEAKSREIFGQHVPFTDNKIDVCYEGVIKVGYVTKDIKSKVDNEAKTITVSLPSPKVFDNYIILDKLKIKEENNILNPLHVSDLPTYFGSIKSEELNKAVKEKNIYAEAEKNAKEVITNILSVFSDYKVVFADR